jgi:hypothetical protein
MPPIDIEQARARLYEDASLTEDLSDEPAQHLLQWAESKLAALGQTIHDEAVFDDAAKALRSLIKLINRASAGVSPEEQADMMEQISAKAAELGLPAEPGTLANTIADAPVKGEIERVQAFIKAIDTPPPGTPGSENPVISPE